MFFLCTYCDQGHRYCGPPCSELARQKSLLEAGQRYQATPAGKSAHAARQRRYVAGQRQKKMTHQSPQEVDPSTTVPPASATSVMETELPGETRTWSHEKSESGTPRCARCGRPGKYVRHETLARCRPRWSRRPA